MKNQKQHYVKQNNFFTDPDEHKAMSMQQKQIMQHNQFYGLSQDQQQQMM